ncbi:hypothetical protein KJ657_02840 [Patescibacteria group bacterium]|nr:hypothetical protein [Patescibacteria group bacterium]MBU1016001.1 hypothetical protein [Patescibacteria group bacterium]MBU1684790.1 hypothetical protein [Patescibacteria group bacterium]MBU1938760.1 hypothetical protein [Patescibacteria group bacterium]
MVEHFDRKATYGFSSALELVRSLATPTTFRSAMVALMVSGCASNGVQQSVKEPEPISSIASKSTTNTGTSVSNHDQLVENSAHHQAPSDKHNAKEKFDAVCQATGEFNITSKDDLLMEIMCVKDAVGFASFRTEDMELRSTSKCHPDIPLAPFANEAYISIERTRDQVTVTLSFRDKKGASNHIELPRIQEGAYKYSFADYVPNDMIPENDFRTFE